MKGNASDETNLTGIDGYIEFEFDLPTALLTHLVAAFDQLSPAALCADSVKDIPDEQGVYQLFFDGNLAYVGKTDGDAGLRSRLMRHSTKMHHRNGLQPVKVAFKAVRVFVFTAMDLEGDLIRHYGGVQSLPWNGSGFGSNDPGKERDTTRVKPANFDARFPIDIDRQINFSISEGETAAFVLAKLKSLLPYTLRYQMSAPRSRKPHFDLERTIPGTLKGEVSAKRILEHIVAALPPGWKATKLPGYVIMYKNDRRKFPSGSVIATSP